MLQIRVIVYYGTVTWSSRKINREAVFLNNLDQKTYRVASFAVSLKTLPLRWINLLFPRFLKQKHQKNMFLLLNWVLISK
jgi:hypothetical protein